MDRDASLVRLRDRRDPWDVLVIGGGATGLGIAVDAAARGHSVALVERDDFSAGTSSRSTKLVHGGVRYLAQGNLSLVRQALLERAILLANAPHLVHDLEFVVPCKGIRDRVFYGFGLGLYDRLAGTRSLGGSRWLSAGAVRARMPGLAMQPGGRDLLGGVLYHDGQFDDARLAVNLAESAASLGACVVNHADATRLLQERGRVTGAVVRDSETGDEIECRARGVVNATGPFCDAVRRLDDASADPIVSASQGVHLVLPESFFPGSTALIVPKTPDGRVVFVIPWRRRTVIGTTDTPLAEASANPRPLFSEIDFLLEVAGRYLARVPTQADLAATFTGIRPLVKSRGKAATKSLSRDHTTIVSASGLLSITGGKWTTYRHMAEDAVNRIEQVAGLAARPCTTRSLAIHGSTGTGENAADDDNLSVYGTDAAAIRRLAAEGPQLARLLHPKLPTIAAQVVWAVRAEMARTVEDVLSRRTRDVVVDARAAIEAAPVVAGIMAAELGRDAAWIASQSAAFTQSAASCLP